MTKKVFFVLAALSFSAAALSAQEKKMYVMKNGVASHVFAVSDVDSIIFYKPGDGVMINGISWAVCNVAAPGTFATKPEDAGMMYQWNRKIGWSANDPMVNSDGGTTWDKNLPIGTEWTKVNDPCPNGWRVPSLDDIGKLFDYDRVSNVWTSIDGVKGRKFTDKITGKSIFMPAVGCRFNLDGIVFDIDTSGRYWSSTSDDRFYGYAHYLEFTSKIQIIWNGSITRGYGLSVRCIEE